MGTEVLGGGHRFRWIAWATAGLLLLLPLVAMQFTSEVNWTLGDFVFAAALLFGALAAFEFVVRRSADAHYRAGAAMAIATAFLMTWSNAAVGFTDSPADLFYIGVVLVAIAGAVVARFRPAGMARAMIVAAVAHASVGVVALSAGVIPAHNSPILIMGISAFFSALWLASSWLFRRAALQD